MLCSLYSFLTSPVAAPVARQRQRVSFDGKLQSKLPLRLKFHPVLHASSCLVSESLGFFMLFAGALATKHS